MATYTAAAGGGNWNVNATWLPATGFPVAGDTAILNATSGPVTVTTNVACLILDCTGYLNTLTINTGFTLNVFGTGATISLGGTISTLQQGVISTRNISITSGAITINFNGVTLPRLFIGYISGAGTQTVTINGSNPTVQNLTVNNGAVNAGAALAVTTLNVSNSLVTSGVGFFGGIPFNFSGTACTVATNAVISSGFNVLNGCTLSLSGPLRLYNGVYTFNPGSALIHNNQTLILSPNVGCTLNTSLVTWYDISDTSARTILTSDLNISRNLTIASAGTGGTFVGSGGTVNININGSLSITSVSAINASNAIINLNGSGVWDGVSGSGFQFTTININTSGYTIGSATRNGLFLFRCTVNLVGLNSCTVNTGHTISIGATGAPNFSTLNTNNTATPGGSEIIWENLSFNSNTQIVLTNDTTFAKNVTTLGTGTATITGAKLFLGGNLTGSVNQQINGTSTIEFTGSTNATWAAGLYQNTIIVNKTGVGTVTTGVGTITWGLANRTFTMNSAVNFTANSTTFLLSGTPLTINNTFGNSFFNVNIPSSTLNITGGVIRINSNLTLTGSGATFAGAFGWDCNNLICSTAGTFNITLQQGVTYRTRTGVSITGGVATTARPTMRSSLANSYAIWTLDFGATQSLIYVNATDIDSSGGQTIWSFGVIPATHLIRTINWNPGVPLRTVVHTFVT